MLPARGDPYRLREPGHARKPPGFEPFGECPRPGAERFLLQRIERRDAAAVLPEDFTCIVKRLLCAMDGFTQPSHRILRTGLLRLGRLQLPLHRLEPMADRHRLALQHFGVDRATFGFERPRPRLELTDARFEMLDTSLLRIHRPGRLALALAQRLECRLQGVYVFLDLTELAVCARRLLVQPGERGLVKRKSRGELFALLALTLDLKLRRFETLGLAAQRAGELFPAPADRSDGLLGACDLRSRVEHVAIATVVRIRRLGVRGSRLLELRLDPALTGERRVQPALLARDTLGVAARLPVEGAPLEREMLGFEFALSRFELTEFLGQGGLALEVRQPASELLAQIVQPIEILDRVAHPVLRIAPALLVLGDSCRFLEKVAQIVRLRLDDPRDHSLLDDRVAARPEPGAEEHIHDVAAPAPRPVQPVCGLPVTHELAAHRDLVVRGKASAGPAVQIVEDELDARPAHRLARSRSVEHDVRHGVAAQTPR